MSKLVALAIVVVCLVGITFAWRAQFRRDEARAQARAHLEAQIQDLQRVALDQRRQVEELQRGVAKGAGAAVEGGAP